MIYVQTETRENKLTGVSLITSSLITGAGCSPKLDDNILILFESGMFLQFYKNSIRNEVSSFTKTLGSMNP